MKVYELITKLMELPAGDDVYVTLYPKRGEAKSADIRGIDSSNSKDCNMILIEVNEE